MQCKSGQCATSNISSMGSSMKVTQEVWDKIFGRKGEDKADNMLSPDIIDDEREVRLILVKEKKDKKVYMWRERKNGET